MSRFLFSLLLAAFVLPNATVRGQESTESQLEFVRKLRAKGYNDLALEHIEKLKKDPNPALLGVLQLETARTMLAVARDKEPEARPGLFAAARAELEAFVNKNAGTPEAAQARLEIARIAAYQGQALLSRAIREEDATLARQAEQRFVQAGQELDAAVKLLTDLAGNYKNPDPAKEKSARLQLDSDRLQARFDRAKNYIDQATTYLYTANEADNLKRATIIDEARKAFESLAEDGGPTGLLAAAWLVKVHHEATTPQDAVKFYKRVLGQTDKVAIPAQRWARLFNIEMSVKAAGADVKKIAAIEDECKKWLLAYPAHHKSPEGLGVRFEYGKILFNKGKAQTKEGKLPPPTAMPFLNQAHKHFAAVAESDSQLAEKANNYQVHLAILKMGEKTPVEKLKTFEDCFLKAQIEIFQMREASKPPTDPKKVKDPPKKGGEGDPKYHMQEAAKALQRAITLADAKTPTSKVEEARFLLAVAHLQDGNLKSAGAAFEAIGRSKPPGKKSAASAGHAMKAYSDLLQAEPTDANRNSLKGIIEFILSPDKQKVWSTEPVSAVARYQLAMLHNKDHEYKEAIHHLSLLPKDFAGYLFAQAQLVFIAMEAKDRGKTDEDQSAFADIARKTILGMPELPDDADPNTGTLYFYAQAEYPKFLYADAAREKETLKAAVKYREMGKFADALKAKLDKTPVRISADTKDKIGFTLEVMGKYSRYGLSDLDYRQGKYDEVLKSAADTVAKVEAKNGDGKGPIKMKDFQITGDLLGLALRANVQKGLIPKAKDILGYMQRLTGDEEGLQVETGALLRSLIIDLDVQIRDLKKAKDEARLKVTVTNFGMFIDELAKQMTKQAEKKGMDPRDVKFLAKFYTTLGQDEKSASLYAQIPPPKGLDDDLQKEREVILAKEKQAVDDNEREAVQKEKDALARKEKEVLDYWDLRVQYARALRLSSKGKDDLNKAKKILDELLLHKNARQQLLAEMEQNHILEDSGLYGYAIKGWGKYMQTLAPRLPENPVLKDLYFQAYYQNTFSLYKYSQSDTVLKSGKEKTYLKAAANMIVRLETSANPEGWGIVGPRFEELLRNEKKLRDEYDELKKASK